MIGLVHVLYMYIRFQATKKDDLTRITNRVKSTTPYSRPAVHKVQ